MKKKVSILSTKEFAAHTGLSTTIIAKLLRTGKITGKKRSGKWEIPISEMHSNIIAELSRKSGRPAASKNNAVKKDNTSKDYTISEFSKITYLTEFGVKEWLKAGKIRGLQDKDGRWRITEENLHLPVLQHLLRHD